MAMWWNRKRAEQEKRQEDLRQARGKLAVAVVELDRKRHHIEELVRKMLVERASGA